MHTKDFIQICHVYLMLLAKCAWLILQIMTEFYP